MRRRRVLGWLAAAVVVGAGGTAAVVSAGDARPAGDEPAVNASPHPTPTATVLSASEPTTLVIPAIGVRAPVGQVGQAADGTVETPPLDRPELTGWYRDGPTPGEVGAAVILGHVDTRTGPAVFHRLRDLRTGDRIEVARADGGTVAFTVDAVERVPKASFPTERVYGDQSRPVLWLVTCGGEFDRARGSYVDNILVSATAAP